jgi:predicted Zn finger-like uncharacterized protein
MMARVPVSCPSCQAQFRVEPALLGRKARCKLCRTYFVLAPAHATATLGPSPWPWVSRGTGSRTAFDGRSHAGTAAADAWKLGDVLLDLYEVREVFTGGGMGLVYRVWHRGWNLELAVKCPRPEYFRDEQDKDNFEREAETWVKLGLHPHTVACYYVRRLAGIPHVFAEYVAGGSLAEWVRTRRLYTGGPAEALARVLDVALQFAWGLQHAHEQGLVHRDVKPGNVLLTDTGVAKVTDFGMARARGGTDGGAAGDGSSVFVTAGGLTPAYCSPEQVRGEPLSRKTDVWSWAVSILEMFTGAATWSAGYLAADVLEDYLARDGRGRRLPAMPAGLAELLRRCFRREPEERPGDMVEVAAVLLGLYREATGRAYPREDPAAAQALADGLNNRAVSLLDLHKRAEAEALWEEALAADPQHPECTYNLGLCRHRAGRLGGDALARQLEEAAASHPRDWLPRYLLAQVYLELGNWDAARQALAGIVGAAADLEEVRAARAAADTWLGAPRKPLRTYEGHADWVSSVALSEDGWFALSGGADRTLRLWDLASGDCLRTFTGHDEWVTAVALAGDGRLALSGSADQTLRLWEVETGRCLRELEAHDKWVLAVALDADGGRGLSGGGDGLLKLWDLANGAEVQRLGAHAGAAAAVWLAPDGGRALSGGRDGTVKLWDLAAGECLRTFTGHADRVLAVCGSTDGRWVLSGSADRCVRLWDAATGACRGAWEGHASAVHAVCLSGDGRLAFSAGGDRALRLWKVPDGRPLAVLEGHGGAVNAVCLGAGGRYAVSASADGTLALWGVPRAVSASHLVSRVLPSEAALAAWADYEQAVARAAQAEGQGDAIGAARLLRQARARPGYGRRPEAMNGWSGLYVRLPRKAFAGGWEGSTLEGHFDAVTAVCVSGDGRTALSAGADHTLRRWELSTGHCLRVLEGHTGVVTSVSGTRDGRLALSGGADGTLRLWDAVQGRCLAVCEGHADVVTSVALSPDGRFALSGGGDGSLRFWEAAHGRCLYALAGHRDPVHAVALSPDGRFALSGSAQFLVRGGSERLFTSGQLRLWETATGRCLHAFGGHDDAITAVAFSADGRLVVSGGGCSAFDPQTGRSSQAGEVHLWKAGSGRRLRAGAGHADAVTSVCTSGDGRYLLSGGADRTVRLWEAATGRCVRTFTGHAAAVTAVALSPDGRWAVSAGADRVLKVWVLDWDLAECEPAKWDDGAGPYLEVFLARHTPYAAPLPPEAKGQAPVSRPSKEVARALMRHGRPVWSEEDFEELLHVLGCAGYGWLRPDGVRRRLEQLARNSEASGGC